MKFKRTLFIVCIVLLIVLAGFIYILPYLNSYQTDGTITLSGLRKPVTVIRDEKGMPYIKAENFEDVITAQGFVTAQDRLFQMQLNRMMAQGRISELAGDKAIGLDTRMRTIGIHRIAKAHARILDQETRDFFQKYADGVNAFINNRPQERPLEFKLSGLTPEPWTIVDSLSVLYYMAWTTSGNIQIEIIAQMLVEKLGPEKALEIFPLNINPDDKVEKAQESQGIPVAVLRDNRISRGTMLSKAISRVPHRWWGVIIGRLLRNYPKAASLLWQTILTWIRDFCPVCGTLAESSHLNTGMWARSFREFPAL